jgi:hypothetical protein
VVHPLQSAVSGPRKRVKPVTERNNRSVAASESILAISLLARINSLLSEIRFPVVVELIPCSVAQGIYLASPRKRLNSQMFSARIFASETDFRANCLLLPCCRAF